MIFYFKVNRFDAKLTDLILSAIHNETPEKNCYLTSLKIINALKGFKTEPLSPGEPFYFEQVVFS